MERDPAEVVADIHDGHVLPDHAETAYAVVERVSDDAKHDSAVNGEFTVDEEATGDLRERRREEGAEAAEPASEWYERERDRVREGAFIDDVKKTYVSSMRMSGRFTEFFTNF